MSEQGVILPLHAIDRYVRQSVEVNFEPFIVPRDRPIDRQMLISMRFGDVNQVHQVRFSLGSCQRLSLLPKPISDSHD